MTPARILMAILLTSCVAAPLYSQESFRGLGMLPGSTSSRAFDNSGDGWVVVGGGGQPFRWTRQEGMTGMGGNVSYAYDVSYDGSFIVGGGDDGAFRRTSETGMIILHADPTVITPDLCRGVSSDGSVVVGGGYGGAGDNVAFVWTTDSGLSVLPGLPNSVPDALAFDVSADGSYLYESALRNVLTVVRAQRCC